MSAASRRLGSGFEIDLLKGFRGEGFEIERLRPTGKDDEGDLVIKDLGHVYVVEAKNVQRINLPGFTDQAKVEAMTYAKRRGLSRDLVTPIAIVKRRGKGWHDAYVVTDVATFFDLD